MQHVVERIKIFHAMETTDIIECLTLANAEFSSELSNKGDHVVQLICLFS